VLKLWLVQVETCTDISLWWSSHKTPFKSRIKSFQELHSHTIVFRLYNGSLSNAHLCSTGLTIYCILLFVYMWFMPAPDYLLEQSWTGRWLQVFLFNPTSAFPSPSSLATPCTPHIYQLDIQWRDRRKIWDYNRSPGLILLTGGCGSMLDEANIFYDQNTEWL